MICDVDHIAVCVVRMCLCGCTDNTIGDDGAQSIGDGLKSLTLLTTLNLNGEWCDVYHIVVRVG